MFGRMLATVATVTAAAVILMVGASTGWADEVGGGPIVVPPASGPVSTPAARPVAMTVDAAPPPFAVFKTTSVGAGLGYSWGSGTLSFDGVKHGFNVRGVGIGDLGMARLVGEGDVHNLESAADFAGTYVALGAGGAAGPGGSTLTMRNEHGVTLTVRAAAEGARLNLGPQSLKIALD